MPDRDGSVDFSMPLGLMAGRPFNPFSRQDFLTLLGIYPLQLGHLVQQPGHQLFQLRRRTGDRGLPVGSHIA